MTHLSSKRSGHLASNKGFTLIELIIVIVILGILSAVAIPKYMNIKDEAATAAAEGVYGTAQSAAAIGFSARLISGSMGTIITDAASLAAAFDGGLPEGWTAVNDSVYTTVGGVTYTIVVGADETTSNKVVLTKDGF